MTLNPETNEWTPLSSIDHSKVRYFVGISFEIQIRDDAGNVVLQKKRNGIPHNTTEKEVKETEKRIRYELESNPRSYYHKVANPEFFKNLRSKIGTWYDSDEDYNEIRRPTNRTYVRYDDKKLKKALEGMKILQVGDFARFKTTSGRYRYRKILEIVDNQAHGQCSSEPNDSGLVLHSSANSIEAVIEIWRNGEQIWPKQ